MNVSVCIATYQRPQRLGALLEDLAGQCQPPFEVVVVDNDSAESGRVVVDRCRLRGPPFNISYAVQPIRNISMTRNRTVALARGDWLAFVDDDERAPSLWLQQLSAAAMRFSADGVLGPVLPKVPVDAPAWIRRGRFYDWTRMPSGTPIPANRLRFGNVLLRASLLRNLAAPFDPAYGLTGGEDGDLLARLVQRGAHVIWCDEAIVHEPVDSSRLSLRWLLLRALRGGQDFARHSLAGRYGPLGVMGRPRLLLRSVLQLSVASLLALVSWPLGRHHAARWALKAAANLGKLSVFLGWHYREYGQPDPA
jgi:succinoglycan biosynthesis protein ExoM